jgi:hypothetical protein
LVICLMPLIIGCLKNTNTSWRFQQDSSSLIIVPFPKL